jgi:hypothetical protein
MKDVLCETPNNYQLIATHTGAQNTFVRNGIEHNKPVAMIIEGSWWENEARTYFNSNESNGDAGRGFGKRDYRYMLTPDFEDGVGPFGTNKGTAMGLSEISSVLVTKQTDANKLAAIKDFIAFTLKEENLRKYTVNTGVIRPYIYNLTEADRALMTPFANNNWDLYKDTENIALVSSTLIETQPISYATSGFNVFPRKAGIVNYATLYQPLKFITPSAEENVTDIAQYKIDTLANNIANAYSAKDWADFLNQAKENGFYK